MFGIGLGETIVILIIVILVFGPKRIAELIKGAGIAYREFRRAINSARDYVRDMDVSDEKEKPNLSVKDLK